MVGFSVNVFIPSGQPNSMWIIEKTNWSGVGLKFPRDGFASEAKRMPELERPGVYVLWGPNEFAEPNRPRVYIGEADRLTDRLSNHVTTDDQSFWQQTIVFTSKDVNLNKAHVLFIEAQLVRIAREVNRCDLTNIQTPSEPNLADRESSYALEFLEAMRLCFPIAGVPFFDELPRSPSSPVSQSSGPPSAIAVGVENTLKLRGANTGPTTVVLADGYINGAEFVVLAGAKAAKEEAPSIPRGIHNIRETLATEGQFADKESYYELRSDFPFSSPSAAAGVLLGRSANGRDEWKFDDGKSINEMSKNLAAGTG